ncbi:phosphonate ABC transporter ATP-binding protein [Microbacterium album]|uniref:Phosphonates import ATP-binding protein PhnC n=1 Tax=Microbacterium album TaxID=2053191 RepID=A0A917ICU1_9MICO|nr:phosphonate ABC transporter ATP-binding protein [Microbacterium album]GGH34446.1 phosphonates import ATP-binding protein PhnC [Microbacterium album]
MITFQGVGKTYPNGVRGLHDIDLTVERGEFVAVIGLSGAGKSTLLRTINRLADVTEGEVLVEGEAVSRATGRRLRRLRSRIGMVFQGFNLVGVSSVQRNVIVGRLAHRPSWLGTLGLFGREDYALVRDALDRVGLAEKIHTRADQLSGGQQQRVAIARALVQQPAILLADEPVASLDPVSTDRVMSDLRRVSEQLGLTVLTSLHSVPLARRWATRIIGMRGGEVVFDGSPQEATDERLSEIYGEEYRALALQGQSAPAAPAPEADAGPEVDPAATTRGLL